MPLICPNCGKQDIVYAGTTTEGAGGYGATDQKYHCKNCGYTGPLVIDTDKEAEEETQRDFPYVIVVVIAFISLAAYGMGANLLACALFFIIPTSLLIAFHYFVKDEDREGVEKDLENLDEYGLPKKSSD